MRAIRSNTRVSRPYVYRRVTVTFFVLSTRFILIHIYLFIYIYISQFVTVLLPRIFISYSNFTIPRYYRIRCCQNEASSLAFGWKAHDSRNRNDTLLSPRRRFVISRRVEVKIEYPFDVAVARGNSEVERDSFPSEMDRMFCSITRFDRTIRLTG